MRRATLRIRGRSAGSAQKRNGRLGRCHQAPEHNIGIVGGLFRAFRYRHEMPECCKMPTAVKKVWGGYNGDEEKHCQKEALSRAVLSS